MLRGPLTQEIVNLFAATHSKRAGHAMDVATARRPTPLECKRLQGFPDGWTGVDRRGKPAPDTQRRKAPGDSMTAPVIARIGRRIECAPPSLAELFTALYSSLQLSASS